jgi:dipeptidyl aminopeptidase/acylaminoacyl peptidase
MPSRNPPEPVRFYSDGATLAGLLNLPARLPAPGVVLSHGYSNDKREFGGFDDAAEVFANAGAVVLRFDFRGCGESEGIPGVMRVATEWTADIRAAVSYLLTRPEVDPDRIAVIGQSMGGGMAACAAAMDDRLRCAVAWAGVSDGERWQRDLWTARRGKDGWQGFRARIAQDRAARVESGVSERCLLAETLAQNEDEAAYLAEMAARFPLFRNDIALESADSALAFRPVDALRHCLCPILFIHGAADALVPLNHSEDMVAAAGDKGRLEVIPDAGHDLPIGPYKGETFALTVRWLEKHLAE